MWSISASNGPPTLHRQFPGGEEARLAFEPVGLLLAVGDVQHRPVETARELHEQQRVGGAGEAADGVRQVVGGERGRVGIGAKHGAGL